MIINQTNSDDYIYLRLFGDSALYPFEYSHLENGTVIRFKIEDLRKWLWRSSVREHLDCFSFEKNDSQKKDSYLPSELYSRIVVTKDINLQISMDSKDILLIDEWLWNRLNSSTRPQMTQDNQLCFLFETESSKSPLERNIYHLEHTRLYRHDGKEVVGSSIFELPSNNKQLPDTSRLGLPPSMQSTKSKIVDCYQFGNESVIVVPLRKKDIIDFNSPVISLLFLNQDLLRMLLNSEKLSESEKEEFFKRDFEGYLKEQNIRYFRLPDYLKLHSLKDITNPKVWEEIRKRSSTFQNIFYRDDWRISENDLDNEGYIRYVVCKDEPIAENELSKIATPLSYEEAKRHYEQGEELKRKKELEKKLQRRAEEYYKRHQARYNKLRKQNDKLTYIDFMIQEEEREKEATKPNVKKLILVLKGRMNNLK